MGVDILQGDSLELLPKMPADSIDSVVTDPPYHLTTGKKGGSGPASLNENSPAGRARIGTGFMGMTWDGGDVAFNAQFWREVLRVCKPGAHLLAFGGTRTFHRMACAIEDAGWEIRDCIMWVYGSGFPKSLNLDGEWAGWGTALKPAWEPVIVARKRLCGTVAANVERHGVGAINVDATRIPFQSESDRLTATPQGKCTGKPGALAGGVQNDRRRREFEPSANRRYTDKGGTNFAALPGPRGGDDKGRWPANVIHDGSDEVLEQFPTVASGEPAGTKAGVQKNTFGKFGGGIPVTGYGDEGSAARFFYCAKASGSDREPWNTHPTVKPVALMRYLVRLVTPAGATVLDPFYGSGTTGVAAQLEGCHAIGIELNPDYVAIAKRRIQQRSLLA